MKPQQLGIIREIIHPGCPPLCKSYALGECSVFVGREPSGPGGILRWHLSIAHPRRYPHWDEIKAARYKLTPPEITMAMILPPPGEYVNIHNNCFHLYEIDPEA